MLFALPETHLRWEIEALSANGLKLFLQETLKSVVITGWPLAGRLCKEFNISKCKERFPRNYSGMEFGPFMWHMPALGHR